MIATLLRGFKIRTTFSINSFCYLFIFSAFIWSLVIGSGRESGTSEKVRVFWLSSDYENRKCEFRFPQKSLNPNPPKAFGLDRSVQAIHAIFLLLELSSHQKRVISDWICWHRKTGSWKHVMACEGMGDNTLCNITI